MTHSDRNRPAARRSARTFACARHTARRRSCSSRSSTAVSGAYSSSAAATASVYLNEAEVAGMQRSSATSAYDHVARLEPTVPLPARRAGTAGEPLRRRRDADPVRPRAGVAEIVRTADAALRSTSRSRRPPAPRREQRRRRCACRCRHEYEARRAAAQRSAIADGRAHSRSSSRSAPSGQPRRAPLELYRALRRVNPSPYSLPARARRARARRHRRRRRVVKCEGRARVGQPDRRDDRSRATATRNGSRVRRATAPST